VNPNPDLPSAPPVTMPESPRLPMDGPLRLVIILMFANIGLSLVLSVLMLIFHTSLVNYEFAHTPLPPNADPAIVRESLESALWGRLVGVLVVSALYVWRAAALRRGKRRAYLRMIWICVIGLLGIVYLIVGAHYPVWMRVEQVIQGLVLIALLFAVTRGPVRDRFAKPRLM
jgi:heme/copper-type cytochrome/quinol oxidase subunit 3